MGKNVLGLQPEFFLVLYPVSQEEDALRSGVAASAGQRIAFIRAGETERHSERQPFVFDIDAAGGKQSKPGDKERHGERGKKKKTHPRRKDAAGLHMAEPERVSQALQRGAHIPEEPFPFLCFVVFKTSDFSFHTHLNSVLPPGKGRRWHRIPGRFLPQRTPYPTQVPPAPRQA